jgi:glycosyl transferase family 2
MASTAIRRSSPAAPGAPAAGHPAADAPGLPVPAPDRPDALAGLSIVVLCRDDAATAAGAIAAAAQAAGRTSLDYEIVAVDDGSSDETAEIIAAFGRVGGRVRLLLHPSARGAGAALRSGIAASSMPWVLLIDASDDLDLGGLEDFLPLAPSHDLLLGWRVMRRGPPGTRVNAAVWNRLVRRSLGVSVRDVDCPVKLVRRDMLEQAELRANDRVIAAELVAEAKRLDARVAEVHLYRRPASAPGAESGPSPRLGVRSLVALARLRRRLPDRREGEPARRVLGLGVAAVAVVAAIGWLYLLRSGGLLATGPRLAGALPLQQLAGDDAQPVLRMGGAWLPAGAIAGLGLTSLGHVRRPLVAAAGTGGILLVLSGAASDAAASSLSPGGRLLPQLALPGLWAAVILFIVGAAVSARLRSRA